jgi:hypothetical protein
MAKINITKQELLDVGYHQIGDSCYFFDNENVHLLYLNADGNDESIEIESLIELINSSSGEKENLKSAGLRYIPALNAISFANAAIVGRGGIIVGKPEFSITPFWGMPPKYFEATTPLFAEVTRERNTRELEHNTIVIKRIDDWDYKYAYIFPTWESIVSYSKSTNRITQLRFGTYTINSWLFDMATMKLIAEKEA